MDRITEHLDAVPIWLIPVTLLLAVAAFVITPANWRIPVTIGFAWFWLAMGKFVNLGGAHAIAKITAGLPFVLVLLAVSTHRGPKRPLNPVGMIYLFLALIGPLFVIRAPDRNVGLIISFYWILLVSAALMLSRVLIERELFVRIFRVLGVTAVFILLVTASSMIFDRGESFFKLRRFAPYGANPNQIGVVLILSYAICVATAVNARGVFTRVLMGFLAFMAFGMGWLTASRSVVAPMILFLLPLGIMLGRQPLLVAAVILSGIPAVSYMMSLTEERIQTGRMSNLETSRPEIWAGYLHVIADQPLMGILESPQNGSYVAPDVGQHPHNAYLYALYYGGIPYGLLMITVSLIALGATLHVYFRRRDVGMDTLWVTMMCTLLVVILAHGFVNFTMWYATYFWAFIHITLACTMLNWSADLQSQRRPVIGGPAVQLGAQPITAAY